MSVHLCMRKLCFDIPVHRVKYSALIVSTQLAGIQLQAVNSTPQASESQIVVSQAVDLTCGISLKPRCACFVYQEGVLANKVVCKICWLSLAQLRGTFSRFYVGLDFENSQSFPFPNATKEMTISLVAFLVLCLILMLYCGNTCILGQVLSRCMLRSDSCGNGC